MLDRILQSLNSDQILPVKDTEGAVLVIAGAGSGKTRIRKDESADTSRCLAD